MTSVDLMMAVTGEPVCRPSSPTACLVIEAVICWPPVRSTVTTSMSVMVPVSWLRGGQAHDDLHEYGRLVRR
jgi:hypothetical protein